MTRPMKDSGIEWIGLIPETWPLQRMKNCISSRDSGAWGEEATGDEGDAICLRIADFDYARFRFRDAEESALTKRHYTQDVIRRLRLRHGDILIEKSGGGEKTPVGRTVIFDKQYEALYANFMDRLRCVPSVSPLFMQYVFVTFYKNEYTRNYIKQTTGIQNLDLTSMLTEVLVPMPSIEEQMRIARYLDTRCQVIDGIVASTEETIEAYRALKQAVITEAVTKGIRGNRPMKDSGVEWIGPIPTDWDIVRIGNQYTERKEKVSDEDYPPLSVTMKGILPQLATAAKTDAHDDRKLVCIGDFAINSRSDRRGSCGISQYEGSVSLINIILTPREEMNPQYYDWLFHCPLFSDEFYRWGHGIVDDLWTTNWQDMKKISIPEPPLAEQQEIADFIDSKAQQIDALIAEKQTFIDQLEAYKKSIIYEYVTGKKEVPVCQ